MGEVARKAQLAQLEELAAAGTWSVDVDTATPSWSPGQHRLYGVDDGAVTSIDDWERLVHPDDRSLWRHALDATLKDAEGFTVDHRIVRSDGSVRWLRCRGRTTPGGGPVVGVSLDTTEHHDASAAVRTFIADAAHELRTPAAAIGQAVAALRAVDDDRRGDLIAVLERQAARLRALTTDLVDIAQLDAGTVGIVLEAVPLREAVATAVSHAPAPEGHSVDVEVPDGLTVVANAVHLDRVLVNLLTNAYRYGGPHVSVRGHRSGERVSIEVADDGPGVSPDVLDSVFEAFRKGPERHPEASGLGLAIVARLVRRFGGEVGYRGDERGAVFVLDLAAART